MHEVGMLVTLTAGLLLLWGLWWLGRLGVVPALRNVPPLGWGVGVILVVYVVCGVIVPYSFTMEAFGGKQAPVPIPSTALVLYLFFAATGVLVYVGTSEDLFREFIAPIRRLLAGEGIWDRGRGPVARKGLLILIPVVAGLLVLQAAMPSVSSPTGLRIMHPTMPKAYETKVNPFEHPTEAMIASFVEEARAGRWDLVRTPRFREFLDVVRGGGTPDEKLAREAYRLRIIHEGRDLYMVNCRPCHGTKADGKGPMARGFNRLDPADFTDEGTIATVTESYALWRVLEGGPALPAEGSPWNSAMPIWEIDITEEAAWKIIMAEYEVAGTVPRKPEKLHE